MADTPDVLKRLEEIEADAQARSWPSDAHAADEMLWLLRLTRALLESQGELMDVAELAWGVIANAGRGDWTLESDDWQAAAHMWGVKAGYRCPTPGEPAADSVIARAEKVRKGEV